MFRLFALAALLAGPTTMTTVATAQVTRSQNTTPAPARRVPPATADTVEGTYVAPGMTGAPKQRVTTDYDNQPLKSATPAKSETSTLSAEPRKQMRKPQP